MNNELYIVGKTLDYDSHSWEFIGIFDCVYLAEAACEDSTYFIGPAKLNENLGDEKVEWTDSYYPVVSD